MLIRLTPAIKSTPNDEKINSISRWMTRNILFTLNRKLCSLAVLSLLLIVQYLHKKYLIYYYRIITHFSQYNNILLCKSTRLFCSFFSDYISNKNNNSTCYDTSIKCHSPAQKLHICCITTNKLFKPINHNIISHAHSTWYRHTIGAHRHEALYHTYINRFFCSFSHCHKNHKRYHKL